MSFATMNDAYETWLRTQCPVVEDDLKKKHARMRKSPFIFLRATFFRWAACIRTVCPALADAPALPTPGDVHAENFGTWRDADGRLVWGLNDFDETARIPYAFDLLRLATSLRLRATVAGQAGDAIAALLAGYQSGLDAPRPALLDQDMAGCAPSWA